jgi:hypothetical protein
MDSFVIHVHQRAAGAKREGPWAIGCFRGGLTTKIPAVVAALRPRPLACLTPTGGRCHRRRGGRC